MLEQELLVLHSFQGAVGHRGHPGLSSSPWHTLVPLMGVLAWPDPLRGAEGWGSNPVWPLLCPSPVELELGLG